MENINKKVNILTALVVVLIALVIILGGSFAYMYFNGGSGNNNLVKDNNENQSEQDNGENIKELSLDSDIVKGLINIFYGEHGNKFGTTEVSEYDDYFYKQDKTIIANIPEEMKMVMTFYSLGNPESVNYSGFEKEYKKIFGNNANIPDIKVLELCEMHYRYEDGNYVQHETSCGGAGCGGSEQELAYAKQITSTNENKIEIYEYFSYYDCDEEQLYADYARTNPIDIPEGASLEEHLDKLGMYKYTFVEDNDGNYVFTSVEKVK